MNHCIVYHYYNYYYYLWLFKSTVSFHEYLLRCPCVICYVIYTTLYFPTGTNKVLFIFFPLPPFQKFIDFFNMLGVFFVVKLEFIQRRLLMWDLESPTETVYVITERYKDAYLRPEGQWKDKR